MITAMSQILTMFFTLLWPITASKHIVFIVADDLGWNDIGFHNNEMITPNIDRLAKNGVILDRSYVQPVCTPSRSSYMTGVYPFKVGLQRYVVSPVTPECAALGYTFLPEKLRQLGYATHMVGKWHLGHCNWNCTPTYRGFDSFLGFYNGGEDYYTKEFLGGFDFRDGVLPINNTEYSTDIYASRAEQIIREHDVHRPLFLYLPFQSVHSPIQVPERYADMYPHIQNQQRREYSGMVTALDEAIGQIIKALEDTGLIKDTLVIFTSDNGGEVQSGGNNYPLRGAKSTIYEGGTRAVAFMSGSGIDKSHCKYSGLMHAVDWFPTILDIAGDPSCMNYNIDGVSQWNAIRFKSFPPRTELVYNLDNAINASRGHAAIRVGDFKLIDGYPGPFRDWYRPDEAFEVDFTHNPDIPDDLIQQLMEQDWELNREVFYRERLYNLKYDPNEQMDIADKHPYFVKMLKDKLNEYRKSLVEPAPQVLDPNSFPANYGGYWSPGWC